MVKKSVKLNYFYYNGSHYSHEGNKYFNWRTGTGYRHIIKKITYDEALKFYKEDILKRSKGGKR